MFAITSVLNRIRQIHLLSANNSYLHKLDALTKLLVLAGFIITVTSFNYAHLERLLYFACYLLLLIRISGTPLATLYLPIFITLPIVLGVGLLNFWLGSETYIQFWGLSIATKYVILVTLFVKSVLTLGATTLLITTTTTLDIYRSLYRLRLPNILILQFILLFNYISVLLQEAININNAYSLRSGKASIEFKDYPYVLGQLFLASYVRAQQVYQAMLCRGFQQEYRLPSIGKTNWALLVVNISVFIYWRF